MKAAVFSHNGLGDGVNCLVLSNNLVLSGFEVDTYQNTMGSMQDWFPHLPVLPYPKKIDEVLDAYDLFLVVHNDTDPFVKALICEGKKRFPEKVKVLYLYPSPNIVNQPYYQDCLTDPKKSIAENFCIVCKKVLKLPYALKENGFAAPKNLVFQKHKRRVVIHPTSARTSRNWPKGQFIRLSLYLEKMGYEPVLVPGADIENWRDVSRVKEFSSLSDLASFIYESGSLIGNDSGLGHLASALKIPTITICRRKAYAKMWGPSFAKNIVITPPKWIPNIRGFRLRDRKWKWFITQGSVRRGFKKLIAPG